MLSRVHRKFIFCLDGVNYVKYMKKYNRWLKKNGMIINGNVRYIHHTVFLDGVDYSKIHLGNDCVISLGCVLLVHDFSVETGFRAIGAGSKNEAHVLKPIIVGENCFIGANCILLPGTELGKNCIVGAGSVLPGKKYQDNSVIVGNPGKVVANTIEWIAKKDNFVRSHVNSSAKF